MRKLKVFGTRVSRKVNGRYTQCRAVVAATSKKAAAEALGVTLYELNTYGSETGNKSEIEVALTKPGTAFARVAYWPGDGSGDVWEPYST